MKMIAKRIFLLLVIFALMIPGLTSQAFAVGFYDELFIYDVREFVQEDGICPAAYAYDPYNCITSISSNCAKAWILCYNPIRPIRCNLEIVWHYDGLYYDDVASSSGFSSTSTTTMAWALMDGKEVYGTVSYAIGKYYVGMYPVARSLVNAMRDIQESVMIHRP